MTDSESHELARLSRLVEQLIETGGYVSHEQCDLHRQQVNNDICRRIEALHQLLEGEDGVIQDMGRLKAQLKKNNFWLKVATIGAPLVAVTGDNIFHLIFGS